MLDFKSNEEVFTDLEGLGWVWLGSIFFFFHSRTSLLKNQNNFNL